MLRHTTAGRRGRGRAPACALPVVCLWLWAAAALAAGPEAPAPASAGPGRPAPDAASIDRELRDIQLVLDAAHFRTALALCDSVRPLLEAGGATAPDTRRARLELMVATAELALGERDRARQALGRARRAWPGLVLDERRTSPRLVALWREDRAGSAPPEGRP